MLATIFPHKTSIQVHFYERLGGYLKFLQVRDVTQIRKKSKKLQNLGNFRDCCDHDCGEFGLKRWMSTTKKLFRTFFFPLKEQWWLNSPAITNDLCRPMLFESGRGQTCRASPGNLRGVAQAALLAAITPTPSWWCTAADGAKRAIVKIDRFKLDEIFTFSKYAPLTL